MLDIDDLSGAERMTLLGDLRARALAQGAPARLRCAGGGGFKVQASGERARLLVWTGAERTPPPRLLEDIGEDMGFFEPSTRPHPCAESPFAVLVFEGLQAPPCTHDWGLWTHYDARKDFGHLGRCAHCGVRAGTETARRGHRQAWTYDTWELRAHVWQRWMVCGPGPGSLTAQAWHTQRARL